MGMLQMTWQSSLLKLSKRKHGTPPLGLKNLGNTCYLNSVLQCLTYTPPLANLCLQCFHSSICEFGAGRNKKRDCPFCILERRITRSLSIEAVIDAPAKINSCLRIYAEHFRGGRQEDAHEFLRYVIDACHNTCLRLKKFQLQQKGRDVSGTGETVVKEIFGGVLQSQVKCLACGAESNKDDEIMDISLDIFHSSSLRESLQKFFQAEILEGNNKYKCENCKELVSARKQMSLLQAPNVLVIQLKRFEGIYGSKIDKPITFDDHVVLSSYMSKVSQDHHPEYSLCGTIVHSGVSPDSGHYYAYIKDSIGHWYCCDDSSVTLSTVQEVLSERVYILFFSRTKQRPRSRTEVLVNGLKSHESRDRMPIKRSASLAKPSSRSGQEAACEIDKLTDGIRLLKEKSSGLEKQADLKASVKYSDSNILTSHSTSNGVHPPIPSAQNGVKSEELSEENHDKNRAYTSADDDVGALNSKCKSKNGFITSVSHMQRETNESLIKEDNGASVPSGDAQSMKAAYFSGISNGENGSAVSKTFSTISPESNGTRKLPVTGNSFKATGMQNRDVLEPNSSLGKRKTTGNGSCIFLSRDDESCAKLDEYKKLMIQDASKVLRTCGWYEQVYSFMHSKKKSCQERKLPVKPDSEMKSSLISDAKKIFNCKVPDSLKASLFEGLQSFGLERDSSET